MQKLYKKAYLKSQNYAHTNTDTCAHTHTSESKNLVRYVVGKAQGKAGKRRLWKFDQLKMLECYSDGKEVVLGTYKKEGGQAERMINPGYQRLSVGHAGVKDRCQFAG